LGIRAAADLKTRLDHAAKKNGRSLSQEAEIRLESSFRDQDRAELFSDAVYGRQLTGLLELLGDVLRDIAAIGRARPKASTKGDDLLSDPAVFAAVEDAIREGLELLRPDGNAEPLVPGGPVGRMIMRNLLRRVAFVAPYSSHDVEARIRDKIGPEPAERLAFRLKPDLEGILNKGRLK
jgi:hypothetical protein